MITWMLNRGMNSKCYLIFEVFFSFFTKETGKLGNLTFISYHLKKILLVVKIITLDFLPFAFIFYFENYFTLKKRIWEVETVL